ncbi:hypothetical protein Tco_0419258 [Tanacetum coccineum]
MLNTQEFIYTVDMFCDILHLPVETPDNPFVTPVNIETIEVFMNKVGYQEEIRATDDFKESETMYMNVDVPMNQPQPVVSTQGTYSSPLKSLKITIRQQKVVEREKDDDDSEDRLEPGSHKDKPENVDDDDDKYDEKVDEKEGGETGSLETRTDKMQTPIPTPPRSPRTILSSDKNITQKLTEPVTLPTTPTSNTPHSKRRISNRYNHLPGALRRMCRRQGYMIQNMERKCVTTKMFWKTHNQVNQVLHLDRDAFRSEVPDLVSQEFNAQAPKIIEELFKNYVQSNVIQVHPTTTTSTETTSSADLQQQLYFKMKRSLQDRANDPTLWEVLKRKFEKSSTSNTSCRDDDIHSHHDDHQEDDAPPEGEKRVKRHKASKISKSARGSSSKHSAKDSTTYVSKQQQQQQE